MFPIEVASIVGGVSAVILCLVMCWRILTSSKRNLARIIRQCPSFDLQRMQALLNTGEVRANDIHSGRTALVEAVIARRRDLVKCLLEKKADVNNPGHKGWTALMYASDATMVKLLVENGADASARDDSRRNAFLHYASRGFTDCARALGAEVDEQQATDEGGRTALMLASDSRGDISPKSRLEMVRYLLGECKLDPEARDEEGRTALMYFANEGHEDTVRYLIFMAKVNIAAKDTSSWTALMHSSSSPAQIAYSWAGYTYTDVLLRARAKSRLEVRRLQVYDIIRGAPAKVGHTRRRRAQCLLELPSLPSCVVALITEYDDDWAAHEARHGVSMETLAMDMVFRNRKDSVPRAKWRRFSAFSPAFSTTRRMLVPPPTARAFEIH
mmetsp:Transcript_16933/g.32082  ORF Transcript_16933/g.32082 Transcript_16933/m.32082 type:complete len:385 (-) Transcript_16933:295-1449(-)